MKKVILLALLMPLPAFGQIMENFESGSIINWVQSTEGHWISDTTASLSGRFSLHHIFDNPDAGVDQIGIPLRNLHPSQGITRWSFLIRYGYDPSSLNNWSVFLMSDNGPVSMSPDGEQNGYAIGVNLTGSDDTLRLWKVKGNLVTTVVNCRINWQTDIGISDAVKITVERMQDGNWIVSVSTINEILIGTTSGTDNELFSCAWFGIYYRYSSTRDRLLWLDDINIEGTFYEDNEAPVISRCEPTGKNSLEITLDEEPDKGVMVPENISLNAEENKPVAVVNLNNLTYNIEFAGEFMNKSLNSLIFKKICDVSGNCSSDIRKDFTPVWAERGDVVISEIMADPLPEVSLPGREYIEITNGTGYSFNLKNWRLSTTGQSTLFPATNIAPSGIIILCSLQDTLSFQKFGRVIGMKQFPALTDGGKIVYISDSTGNLIHGVEYAADWYKDELKSDGGWSLEMIDIRFPFYYAENWKASESNKGGTPGCVNSVSESNPDISFYGIQNVFPVDSTSIHIRFSEPVFSLQDGTGSIQIGDKRITNIINTDPLFREFDIKIASPLRRAEIYNINISDKTLDFAGNRMQKSDYKFGLAEPAEPGDILFNEVLFNPLPGDPDYLEFYNCSDKIIDASRLQLISVNDASGNKSDAVSVSGEARCILPQEYYAVTTDKRIISERYISTDPDHLYETGSLPSMPDDEGHLILYNRELERIDELVYNDDFHYSLLSSHEGVSLEKINPRDKSGETDKWHSASESSGWGTPGAPNSMFTEMSSTSDKVVFSSSRITPDNDGNEDLLTIRMNLKGNGNVVSVTVFDETGNYVRKLATNLYAGAEASVVWDGTSDAGSLVRTGIYIILITLYDDTGKTERWKKVCTVIRN
jgi:Lamin Tail Domain/CHU_C Type IX secretion signal domain